MAVAEKHTIPSFEETYKTAYSHGLEQIYSLESVDPKSIRLIETKTSVENFDSKSEEVLEQFELDLGDEYRGWMESFVLSEPINVLNLSKQIQQCLIKHEKFIIKDVIETNHQEFLSIKGMGQGHIDEIENQLKTYTNNKNLYRCKTVNFSAWLRSLLAAQDRVKTFVCLESYGLEALIELTPAERSQLWNLSETKKECWIQEIFTDFNTEQKKQAYLLSMQQFVSVFLTPWIRGRQGLVSKMELLERIERIAEDSENLENIMQFFGDVYCDRAFPLDNFICRIDQNLYCSDPFIGDLFHQIIKKALTYFYNPTVHYSLSELSQYIAREYAKRWLGFPDEFIEKALRISSIFRVRKAKSGILTVLLS